MVDYVDFSKPTADHSVLVDDRGVRRTQTLFWEMSQAPMRKRYPPLYTLARYPRHGLPSAFQIYIDSVDEADAARKLVGSVLHWDKLCSLKWFVEGHDNFEGINQWREEMRKRDQTAAKRVLLERLDEGDLQAAKKLYDETKDKAKVTKVSKKGGRGYKPEPDSPESKIAELHKRIQK